MTEDIPEEKSQESEPAEPAPQIEAGEYAVPDQTSQAAEPLAQNELPAEGGPGVVRSIFIVVAGWFVPGLGHLLQRRLGRALVGFLAVAAMALAGLRMRGTIFPPHGDDAFGVLGFIADAGAGVFYLLAHGIETAGPDVSRAAGDYGTRLLATAGVINLLFILDALEISLGRKN